MKWVVLAVLLIFGGFVPAQVSWPAVPVRIIVMDRTGAVVVGAPIRISPALANFPENAETDQTGRFSLKITPVKYNIFVSAFAFAAWGKCAEIKPESRTIDIVLPIAEKTSEVDMGGPSFPLVVMNMPSSTASARTMRRHRGEGHEPPCTSACKSPRGRRRNSTFSGVNGRASVTVRPSQRSIEAVCPGLGRQQRSDKYCSGTVGLGATGVHGRSMSEDSRNS